VAVIAVQQSGATSKAVTPLIAVPGDAWSECASFSSSSELLEAWASLPQQIGLRRFRFLTFRISRRIEIKILQPLIVAGFD
jgi:hypothetical protein